MARLRGLFGKSAAPSTPEVKSSEELQKLIETAFEKNNEIKQFHSAKIQKISYEGVIKLLAEEAKLLSNPVLLEQYITHLNSEILKFKIEDLRILAKGYIVSLANLQDTPEKQSDIMQKFYTELDKIPETEYTRETQLLLRRFITSLSLDVIAVADKMKSEQDVEEKISEEKSSPQDEISDNDLQRVYKYGYLGGIPENKRTESLCMIALTKTPDALKYIPENLFTKEICISIFEAHKIKVPEDYITFLTTLDLNDRKCLIDLMCKNISGFLTYEKMLLTCAELASGKETAYLPNKFTPTVLNGVEEFLQYLQILKNAPLPCRERFIIRKGHSHAGDIQITEDGQVSVLFADSYGRDGGEEMTGFAEAFPGSTIYTPANSRQTDVDSCHKFAISDLMLFYTVERRLPAAFSESGLHGYLEHSKQFVNQPEDSLTTHCLLPMPFLRTSQHHPSLVKEIEARPEEEKALPINKKGELLTAENSTRFFKFDDYHQRLVNIRLKVMDSKRDDFIRKYIIKMRNIQPINDSMNRFTLEGFRQRIQRQAPQHVASRKI